MRRYLFSLLSILALAAVVPAIALAHSGDHRGDRHDQRRDRLEIRHRHHRRHHRVEHFREHAAKPGKAAADAGTVKSFQAGVLTIALTDGSTVSGRVNRHTEVECEAMGDHFTRDDGGPGPSGNGGGDQGDRGDQGDDRGDRNDANDANDANANDANDDNGNDANDNDNDNPRACAVALRTPGTHVRDATLILTGTGAVWDHVDLDI
jgi:hypothetical protein